MKFIIMLVLLSKFLFASSACENREDSKDIIAQLEQNEQFYKKKILELEEKIMLLTKEKKVINNKYITKIGDLIWQDSPYTREEKKAYYKNKNYKKAGNSDYVKQYCKELRLGGYHHWKLPTKEQLLSLYENKSQLKNNKNYRFWSSTQKDARESWVIAFNFGSALWYNQSHSYFVRCVQ